MVVDFHTHIFPEAIAERTIRALEARSGMRAYTDGTLDGLLAAMQANGIDLSVILPVVTKPSQWESVNTFAQKVNERYAGKLLSFGGIHPDSPDYKRELDGIKARGLCGIKLHPDYQGVMIDDERYLRIIAYADELGLIVITHAGVDIGLPEPVHCPPERLRRVLREVKPKRFVAAHYGGWRQWEAVYEQLAGEDVYLDTSCTAGHLEPELFLRILKKHDENKILFATDSPWGDGGRGIAALKQLDLPETVLEKILSGNAKRLLQWKEQEK